MARVLAEPRASAITDASRDGMRWADLRVRVISAAVLAPIALFCLWRGGLPWNLLILGIAAGLMAEWQGLCRPRGARGAAPLAVRLAGLPYVGLTAASLIWMRADPVAGRDNVLFLVLLIWTSDSGAYAFGRLFGGPRLAPTISPGKTWAGAAGGVLAAAALGAALGGSHRLAAALAALLLSVVGQMGDLMESAIKRGFGVKDVGSLIPGHGGLFDRLDAMLTATPVAALMAIAAGHGMELWVWGSSS